MGSTGPGHQAAMTNERARCAASQVDACASRKSICGCNGRSHLCGLLALVAVGSTAARADPEVQALAITTGVVVLGAMLADGTKHNDPDYLALEVGGFDPIKNTKRATAFGSEYRFGQFLWWSCGRLSAPASLLTAAFTATGDSGLQRTGASRW